MSENGMILEEQDGILVLSMNMAGNNLMTADFLNEQVKPVLDKYSSLEDEKPEINV